ncbi:MAG TPA: hypothetical protein VM328_11215 [Fimbriimonadaceae bacterium]|nr:hypothetical protein [Fimbriimonadaceae bacterium]
MPFLPQMPKGLAATLFLTGTIALVIGCGGGGSAGGGTLTGTNTGTNTNTTTNGSTNGTNTTTNTTTNGGTTGSTTGTIPNNKIFYSLGTGTGTEVYHIDPNGQNDTLYGTLPDGYSGFGANPQVVEFVFGHDDPGTQAVKYGLFVNGTVNVAGASQLTARTFDAIGTIQFTPDGQTILFTASIVQNPGTINEEEVWSLYRITRNGGLQNPTKLDDGEDLDISPDGTRVVYTKLTGTFGEIYTRNVDGTGTATRLTNNTFEDWMPQYSKDGQRIVFSSDRNGTNFDIYTMTTAGGGVVNVTNTGSADEYGPSYSADSTQISFVVLALDPSQTGLFRINANGASRTALKLAPNINLQTWWSPGTGNGPQRLFGRLSMDDGKRRRRS